MTADPKNPNKVGLSGSERLRLILEVLDTFAGLASPGYQQAVEIAGLTKEEDPWGKPPSAGVPPDSSLRLSN